MKPSNLQPFILLSAFIGLSVSPSAFPASKAAVHSVAPPNKASPDRFQHSFSSVLKAVMPTVVNIRTQMAPSKFHNMSPQQSSPQQPPEYSDFQPSQKMGAVGSGVVFEPKEGYILTNLHVVKDAEIISVTLHDGRIFPAELVGGDPETDLAMLQIKAKNLTAMPFSDSDKLEVGDFVVAIGSPFGLNQTVTSGIVSALGREIGIEGYEDFIQTDAPINPGNSGGALINVSGQLVGINTAILSPEGSNIGIGFAIPINMAKNIGEQLIQFGKVRRGLLGVTVQTLTPDLAESFGTAKAKGALIDQITPYSLAEQNGLAPGDIVTSVNNRSVSNTSDLRNSVGLVQIGENLELQVLREGKPLKISFLMKDPATMRSEAELIFPQLSGALLLNAPETHTLQGVFKGVRLHDIQPGSPAWEAGLRPFDLIVAANRKPVLNLEDLKTAAHLNSEQLLLRVLRDRSAFFMVLKNPE